MSYNETIVSFDDVSFEFVHNKPLLNEVSFSVRRGSKITFMGQNGAGKSTIFQLMMGELEATSGSVNIFPGLSVAKAHQVMPHEDRDLTILEFFQKYYQLHAYDIGRKIDDVLEVVNLHAPHDKVIRTFSGGQQARLLLAAALIQKPDLLLLDEPTNNLDKAGIEHLTNFIVDYRKTCIVISHDEDFLNSFTEGVLYLDVFTKKVEQYVGNYYDALEEITVRREKENRQNSRVVKEIQENKEKANYFANKGGKLRLVAKRMRNKAEELEEEMVDVRREDKTIRAFEIPAQEDLSGEILKIESFTMMKNHKVVERKMERSVRKNEHLLLSGPNGIGKSTLLEAIAEGTAKGSTLAKGIRIGYYRQDFSTLNFEHTVRDSLLEAFKLSGDQVTEERLRTVASGFLINSDLIQNKVGSLSEGQKGLVSFARLVLQRPGLLILDEPTNHINFRHIPIIAAALHDFEGAMILVSHVPEFVEQVRIDHVLDLDK